jgi:hypothetical protein
MSDWDQNIKEGSRALRHAIYFWVSLISVVLVLAGFGVWKVAELVWRWLR